MSQIVLFILLAAQITFGIPDFLEKWIVWLSIFITVNIFHSLVTQNRSLSALYYFLITISETHQQFIVSLHFFRCLWSLNLRFYNGRYFLMMGWPHWEISQCASDFLEKLLLLIYFWCLSVDLLLVHSLFSQSSHLQTIEL